MVLASVVTTTAREIEWVTRGIGIYFPEAGPVFAMAFPKRIGRVPSSMPITGF